MKKYLKVIDLTPSGIEVPFISGYLINLGSLLVSIEQGPKSSYEKLYKVIKDLGFGEGRVDFIVTHIHIDHSGSVATLLNLIKDSVAYVHPKGVKHLIDPDKLWRASLDSLGYIAELYGRPDNALSEKIISTEDDMDLNYDGNSFKIIHTIGHASHHQSIYWVDYKAMFVGDSAGIYVKELNYIIPGTIYPTRLDLYISSLKKMISYRPRYLMYPHYGIVEDGTSVLESHLKQVIDYYKIARELDVKELDVFISELIRSYDEIAILIQKTRDIPILKMLIEMSFMGLLREAERLDFL